MANMIDYSEKVLQVKNLKKYFRVGSGKRKLMIPAVDDVTLDVYKREVFGVVGESGSGKTTLGRTIIKLYQPTDGTVILNNFTISAGTQGYLEKIKSIKDKLNEDILSLNPSKIKEIELRKEATFKIELLEAEKNELKKQKEIELLSNSKQFDQFRADNYQLIALMNIDIQKVIFDFNQKVMKIKRGLQNEALLKFNNEVKIANDKLAHKMSGLKDSAALDNQTISNRVQELKSSHAKQLALIKSVYEPQIQANASTMLTKIQVNNQINQLTIEKNKQLLVIKASYSKQRLSLVEPNKALHQQSIKAIEDKFNKSFKTLDSKISIVKKELYKTIAALPKPETVFKKTAKSNTDVHKLKVIADLKIKELHAKMSQARRVNASKDTLKESQKMQMIFQDPISSLNPRMTVKEIISEGLVIQGNLSKDSIEKKSKKFLRWLVYLENTLHVIPTNFLGVNVNGLGLPELSLWILM